MLNVKPPVRKQFSAVSASEQTGHVCIDSLVVEHHVWGPDLSHRNSDFVKSAIVFRVPSQKRINPLLPATTHTDAVTDNQAYSQLLTRSKLDNEHTHT